MFLEVTRELFGEPLVPQMRPGGKNDIKLEFIPAHPGNIFGTSSEGNLEEITVFFSPLFEAVDWVVFYCFLLNFGCCFRGLVGVVGKYFKQ